MTRRSDRLSSSRMTVAICLFSLMILWSAPARAADIVFTWVPTDGSSSSGTMTIDAPSTGHFTRSQAAVRSLSFTFRPGFTVTLALGSSPTSNPIMSFDGGGLDSGTVQLGSAGEHVTFSFLPEQLGADTAFHEVAGSTQTVERLRGHWVRRDITVTKPPYPNGLLKVIDVGSVYERHSSSNPQGIAYDRDADVLYAAISTPTGGFIYTLDLAGRLLREVDFGKAYRAGTQPTALTYDPQTRHLFVFAFGIANGTGTIVEMSVDASQIFREITLPTAGSGPAIVRADGIWQPRFADRVIRHFSADGVFIEDVPLDASVPQTLFRLTSAESFPGSAPSGFFAPDFNGRQFVAIDGAGRQVAAVSTAILGNSDADGRINALTVDAAGQRLFLLGNGTYIFVLSPDFLKVQQANELFRVDPTEVRTAFVPTDPLPFTVGRFTIDARFRNISDRDVCGVFFRINQLKVTDRNEFPQLEQIVSLPSGEPIQGFDEIVIGHRPFAIPASTDAWVRFTIDLQSLRDFNFFVDVWGTPQPAGTSCP